MRKVGDIAYIRKKNKLINIKNQKILKYDQKNTYNCRNRV